MPGTAVPLSATITGGAVTGGSAFTAGGRFMKLTPPLANPFGPPNSVGNNTFQSPNLLGSDEDQNILLLAGLPVDGGTDPIPAGSTVASHYVFFDPGPSQSIVGTVDFDSNVLSIITSTANLAGSDFLANAGVNYLNPGLRGLEGGDSVTISGARQISFDTTASNPGDYVRVPTTFSPGAVVPGPSAVVLIRSGLAGLSDLRRLLRPRRECGTSS